MQSDRVLPGPAAGICQPLPRTSLLTPTGCQASESQKPGLRPLCRAFHQWGQKPLDKCLPLIPPPQMVGPEMLFTGLLSPPKSSSLEWGHPNNTLSNTSAPILALAPEPRGCSLGSHCPITYSHMSFCLKVGFLGKPGQNRFKHFPSLRSHPNIDHLCLLNRIGVSTAATWDWQRLAIPPFPFTVLFNNLVRS